MCGAYCPELFFALLRMHYIKKTITAWQWQYGYCLQYMELVAKLFQAFVRLMKTDKKI